MALLLLFRAARWGHCTFYGGQVEGQEGEKRGTGGGEEGTGGGTGRGHVRDRWRTVGGQVEVKQADTSQTCKTSSLLKLRLTLLLDQLRTVSYMLISWRDICSWFRLSDCSRTLNWTSCSDPSETGPEESRTAVLIALRTSAANAVTL